MTGQAPAGPAAQLLGLGPELHRSAVMLVADGDAALALVAEVLRSPAAGRLPADPAGARCAALTELVRAHLRHAPRGGDRVVTGDDPGEVLQALSPRARAATVLRLVHGWEPAHVARAVRVPPGRVTALVPSGPGIEAALEVVAEREALPADVVLARLRQLPPRTASGTAYPGLRRTATSGAPGPAPRRRRRLAWLAALSATAGALVTYAVSHHQEPVTAEVDDPAPELPDLTAAGWLLDEAGDPPTATMGLRLLESVRLDYQDREKGLTVDGERRSGSTRWAVLWCDMPPVEDPNVRVPHAVLGVAGEQIELPCAGRDGTPPVRRLVAVPPGNHHQQVRVTLHGDLVLRGSAVLALYAEPAPGGLGAGVPAPRLSGMEELVAPAAPDLGAVVLDRTGPVHSLTTPWPGNLHAREVTAKIRVGPESTVDVWAGDTGVLTVLADGLPVTDDGDASLSPRDTTVPEPDLPGRDHAWRTQDPLLRDGQWLVPVPGVARTFPLPEELRPGPGEEREVTVTVPMSGGSTPASWQVVVRDAVEVPLEATAPALAPVPPTDQPRYVAGRELVGVWQVPADGVARTLTGLPGTGPAARGNVTFVAVGPQARAPTFVHWPTFEDIMAQGRSGMMIPVGDTLEAALHHVGTWPEGPLDPRAPVELRLAPRPGHPELQLLAYATVPWEDYDATGAPPPADAWPAGSAPPTWAAGRAEEHGAVQAFTASHFDEAGRLELPPASGPSLLRMTSEGQGRLRVTSDGRPVDATHHTHGWWSSYTDQHVTVQLDLYHAARPDEMELRLDGDEEFRRSLVLELIGADGR